jgi:signal transduction histidine kinase/CheY-like chemotaxis protein
MLDFFINYINDNKTRSSNVKINYPFRIVFCLFIFSLHLSFLWGSVSVDFIVLSLLLFHSLVYPHIINLFSFKSSDEIRNIKIDTFFYSFCCAIWGYNIFIVAVFMSTSNMTNLSAGGRNLFFKGLIIQVAGLIVGGVFSGFYYRSELSDFSIAITLVGLFCYTGGLGMIVGRITNSLRENKLKLEDRENYLEHLNELALSVNSTLDLDVIMVGLMKTLESMYPFESLLVVSGMPGNQTYKFLGAYGAGITKSEGLAIKNVEMNVETDSNSIFINGILKNRITNIPDLTAEAVNSGPEIGKVLYGIKPSCSICFFPVRVGDEVVAGVVFVNYINKFNLNKNDLKIISEYLVQVGTAIKNVSIYEVAEKARKNAEESEKAKSQFLANMSHEIRTPLTAIIGYSETIRDNKKLSDSKKSDYLATVIGSSHHLLDVINDILDVSKIESEKMVLENIPLSIPDFILSIKSLYEPLAQKKGVEFNVLYDYPFPSTVMGDSTRLKQVIINLLGNALKFTDTGTISLHVSYDKESKVLTIKVVDTGIGMTEQECNRIFESFTQADVSTTRTYGGTGLGLTIAKNLSELMGGTISVNSVSGAGSEFTLSVKADVASNNQAINNLEEVLLNTATLNTEGSRSVKFSANVLIAEDNKDIQGLLVSIVEGFGCVVTACDNGSDALVAFCKGDFDLVLTDINMPIISGVTLVRMLRSKSEKLPIFAITANVMQHEVLGYLEVGCSEVIAKPVDRNILAQSMIEHLPYHRLVSEENESPSQEIKFQGRILLAEDNLVNQEYISRVLESLGLTVISVNDGEQALEKCLSDSFDLVLLDLNMPKASGFEVLEVLQEMSYAIPVYALTADNSELSKAKCLESGFVACLNKPLEKEKLEQVLKQHLQVKSAQDEASTAETVDFKIRFTESLPKLLAELNNARSENNWDGIKDVAHQLKGAAGSFGYDSITDLSKELERSLKDNKVKDAELIFHKLTDRIKQVTSGYHSWKSNLY